jgi:hypothetical protein
MKAKKVKLVGNPAGSGIIAVFQWKHWHNA